MSSDVSGVVLGSNQPALFLDSNRSNLTHKPSENQEERVDSIAQNALNEAAKLKPRSLELQKSNLRNGDHLSGTPRVNLLENDSPARFRDRSNSVGKVVRFNDQEQQQFLDTAAAQAKLERQENPQTVKIIALSPTSKENVAKEQREVLKAARKASPFVYVKIANLVLEKMNNPTPNKIKFAFALGLVGSALSVVGAFHDIVIKSVRTAGACLENKTS